MSNTNNTQSLTVYTGTFVTQTGFRRTMNFVRLSEAPSGTFPSFSKQRKLSEGSELVWDIDQKQYRTYNTSTQVGSISSSTQDVSINLF
jgi:hypothetical protein